MNPESSGRKFAADLPAQFLRFAVVGVGATGIQYVLLWVFTARFGMLAAIASAIGYVFGVVFSYVLNYLFTFRSGRSHLAALPRYLAVVGVGWCVNTLLMALFVHRWNVNLWVSQVLTTGIVLFWNFSASRWWAFRPSAG